MNSLTNGLRIFAAGAARTIIALAIFSITLATPAAAQVTGKEQRPAPIARPAATPAPPPSSQITSVNANTGVVAAKVNSTGQTFQFTIKDAALLNSLHVGQGVYANFKTNQVSLDGKTPAGTIVSLGPVDGSRGPVQGLNKNPGALGPASSNCPPPTPCPPTAICQVTTPPTGGCPGSPIVTGCVHGYFGPDCALACPGGPGNICSSNGACSDGLSGNGTCSCPQGFNGNACQYSNAVTCKGHGKANFDGSCTCDAGYSGASCNTTLAPGAPPPGPVDAAKPLGPVNGVRPPGGPAPAAEVASIDSRTGLATGRETATGRTFQFRLNDPAKVKLLAPGQGLYVNYKARQVSLDGKTPAGWHHRFD